MSDWAVAGVTLGVGPGGGHRATVILSQRAEINESTTLGFSFDGGATYPHRVPIVVPRKPRKEDPDKDGKKDDKRPPTRRPAGAPGGGTATVGDGADPKPPACEWVDETHLRVEVDLPGPPDQVMVDPDLVIPDADPVNNRWKVPINYRPRPFYTILDETNFTNDYDKWNVIYGPYFYGATYNEGCSPAPPSSGCGPGCSGPNSSGAGCTPATGRRSATWRSGSTPCSPTSRTPSGRSGPTAR